MRQGKERWMSLTKHDIYGEAAVGEVKRFLSQHTSYSIFESSSFKNNIKFIVYLFDSL